MNMLPPFAADDVNAAQQHQSTKPIRVPDLDDQSWSEKSAQGDKWSFCLTAGTLCLPNQERP
jgi:hypothetical protein